MIRVCLVSFKENLVKEYVVRIVQTEDVSGNPVNEGGCIGDNFLNALSVAGLIVRHPTDPAGLTMQCFDLRCPLETADSRRWAESVAKSLKQLGFNAAAAPATVQSLFEMRASRIV